MIEVYTKKSKTLVFWQEPKSDEVIGEPAMILKVYSDGLQIRQGRQTIMIEKSCVPEFIRAIHESMSSDLK